MASWEEYSAADFDATLAPRAVAARAKRDARAGQGGLFHVAAPVARPAAPAREELPGQLAMFGDVGDLADNAGGEL